MTDTVTETWTRNASDRIAVANGCYLDEKKGRHAVAFFEKFLRHSKGQWAGKPFKLLDWQRDNLIMPLFGWMRKDGTRRFRVGYIEIPKKQGKSTILSAIGLYLLLADGEQGSEVYGAASDRDQAGIVYREAASMARSSPDLAGRLDIVDSRKNIAHLASNSFYRVLSADAFRAEGLNIHGLLFDELHAQRDRRLWDALRYGGASRRQPLLLSITTAGYDRHSICWEQREYALKTLDGTTGDDSFFGLIYAAEPSDDWTSPATWHKANPSLGVTVPVEEMAAACKEAQESPAKENAFKRYRLNIWTEQDVRWLTMDRWDSCGSAFDEADLAGRECFAGLDLSTKTDITACVYVFPPIGDDPKWYMLLRCWVPADNAELRGRRDRVPYPLWIKQGHMKATDGNVVDYEVVKADVLADAKRFVIREIAYDPWNATQIALQLQSEGATVVEFGQGFRSMSEPTKEMEKLVIEGLLNHGNNPVLRWMAGNVSVEQDPAGNLKPSKKKSTERIDGIVAGVMALGRAMVTNLEPASYFRKESQL